MTLLLRGGQTIDSTLERFEPADLLVDGGRLVAVGHQLSLPADGRVLDVSGCVVLPGLINSHTHAHNNLLKCLGDNWTLEDLLNHRAAVYDSRTPEDQYVSAALGAIEMLKTGCTAAFDLFATSPAPTNEAVEAVVAAYTDVGMRVVLAPSVSDTPFFWSVPGLVDMLPADLRATVEGIRPAPMKNIAKLCEAAIRRWDGSAGGRIRFALAPTIPGQCSDELLIEFGRLSREYQVPLHSHLVETKVQAVNAMRRWGKTMVSRLAELDLLGPRFVGAHGVWLTEEDIAQLADAGASIAHNPASNLKLGSGIAPVRELLDRGVNVGLATDGSMSSDNQNMFEAMRFAALINKVRFPHRPDRWVGSREAWQMATTGSARALGLQDEIGAIAVGRKADLTVLRLDSPFLRPLNHAANALVYAETAADVETVIVDGRVVVERGQVVTVDESALRARAQEAAERLRVANAPAWEQAARFTPYVSKACQAVAGMPFPVNRYAASI